MVGLFELLNLRKRFIQKGIKKGSGDPKMNKELYNLIEGMEKTREINNFISYVCIQ